MAKFANNTLTQVAGFDGQILAQELVYQQKDFWNMTWKTTVDGVVSAIDLTDVDIDAKIIRREITNLVDGRYGLEFDISDYPQYIDSWSPQSSTHFAGSSSSTNLFTTVDAPLNLKVGDPVRFSAMVFGGVSADTTYYVKSVPSSTTFSISETLNGSTFALTDHSSGGMYLDKPVYGPLSIDLTITNRIDADGQFTLVIDDDTWDVLADDPELNISATDPVCFSGRIKLSFPAVGSVPAYDEQVFLLFLIRSDGVVN